MSTEAEGSAAVMRKVLLVVILIPVLFFVGCGALIMFGPKDSDFSSWAIQGCRERVRDKVGKDVEFRLEEATDLGGSERSRSYKVTGKARTSLGTFTYECRGSADSSSSMMTLTKFAY